MSQYARKLVGGALCATAAVMAVAVASSAWAELTPEEEIRLKALEEQMEAMRAKQEKKDDKEGTPVRTFYNNGLKFKSDDGNFNLSVGGRVMENGRFFATSNPGSNTFYNKETQIEMKGTVYKKFYYEFEGNLTGSPGAGVAGTSFLNNSFIRYQHNDFFGVTVGQFKEPFWYEESTSTLWKDFAEKSIGDVMAPSRGIGVQVQGAGLDKRAGYELGYFNSSAKNTNDIIDDKSWAGRLTLKPFLLDTASPLNKLQLHGMFTWGRTNASAPANFKTPDTGTQFLTFNAGTLSQQDVSRLGYGAFWAKGPLNLKGEWETMRLDLARTGLAGPLSDLGNENRNTRFDAWYATVGYFLTGEDAIAGYDRVSPKNPWNKEGGYGAWQVLGRFSGFQAEREPFLNLDKQYASAPLPQDSTFNTKTGSTTFMNAWMVGLNWVPISNAKVFLNYGENHYGADVIGAPGADIIGVERVFMLGTQFDF